MVDLNDPHWLRYLMYEVLIQGDKMAQTIQTLSAKIEDLREHLKQLVSVHNQVLDAHKDCISAADAQTLGNEVDALTEMLKETFKNSQNVAG